MIEYNNEKYSKAFVGEEELAKIYQGEDLVFQKHYGYGRLVGSFIEDSEPEERYIYINRKRVYTDINFNIQLEEPLQYLCMGSSSSSMFSNKIKRIDEFPTTEYITDIFSDFQTISFCDNCRNLEYVNLSNFKTENFDSIRYFFRYCYALQSLDLSSFNTENITDVGLLFFYCEALQSINFGDNFNLINCEVEQNTSLFTNCKSLTTVIGKLSNIKIPLNLKDSPLTRESALVFLNGLAHVEEPQTITFSKGTYATLSEEDKQIAYNKNWQISS